MLKTPAFRRDAALFWISCLMLFFEILMIRWLSAEIRIFSYFHNMVLLFCFLGIGLGCAMARRRVPFWVTFVILLVLAGLLALDEHLGVFSLSKISHYLSLGFDFLIWYRPIPQPWPDRLLAIAAGNGMLLFLMTLITLFFVPFGQILGQLLDKHERPLRAYAVNLAGSLAGVWLFNLLSLFSLPPPLWVGLGGLCCLVFLSRRRWQLSLAILMLALTVLALYERPTPQDRSIWSPYQKLTVQPVFVTCDQQEVQVGHVILVNNVGYMQISNYSPDFMARCPSLFPLDEIPYDHYNIPYRFSGQLDDVLIVGTGAGNDVAGALRNGAGHVTAVEIDPVIIRLGRELHPEAPYSDARVTVINDDARSFFKKATGRYDMVVFGLLDSHTLSSSYSNVRLDNYVYTVESFAEVKRLLKPHGVVVLMFEVADDFIGARIQQSLAEAFGQEPLAFSVRSGLRGWGGFGFVVGDPGTLERSLAQDANLRQVVEEGLPLKQRWAESQTALSTDDWPYLYLEGRAIPGLYYLIFAWLLLFSYWGIRRAVGRPHRMDWHFFLLGAGFMLLEVQNISKLALLFGTTWTVNAIVITAFLVMALLSNYVVQKVKIRSLRPIYIALFIAVLVNLVMPFGALAGMPPLLKGLLAGIVMALPVFFSGIIFSTSFSRAQEKAGVFASNLFGSMVGGVLESLSFFSGIRALLLLAFVLYFLSMWVRRHSLELKVPAA